MSLIDLSLRKASDLLREGEVSSVELTHATLRRIEDLDSRLHAYLTVMSDTALDQAQRAVDEREDILAPVKDIEAILDGDGNFVFEVEGRQFAPTDHAIEQFAIRTKVPSSSVMRELRNAEDYDGQDGDCMTRLANNALRRLD